MKQMKIIHLKGYSEDELYQYRPTVFKNLIECAKAVIHAMQQFDIEPEVAENKSYSQFILKYTIESGPSPPSTRPSARLCGPSGATLPRTG